MKIKLGLLIVSGLILSGCSSPGALISMPQAPAAETDNVSFMVTTEKKDLLNDNVVQSRAFPIPVGSSVVIAVPDKKSKTQDSHGGDFKTDGFFSAAEQQIERSLLRNGFQVKDRAKFEAILRDLRDARGVNTGRWSRYGFDERDFDPAMRPLLQRLTEQLDKKEISESEFYTQLEELRSKARISSESRSRSEGEDELTDISEVIRAASASDVRADYVLQIHEFQTLKLRDERINLFNFAPVREFMNRHPDLERHFISRQFFPCQSLEASLNAKLIHVKTGNVVWIGNHSATELDTEQSAMQLELTYQKQVANYNKVREFVEYQNQPGVRELRGDLVTLPDWQFRTDLIGPTHIAGANCKIEQRSNDEINQIRTDLSRRVATELISTIKVGDF
uniref:Lipoprotein n=1 Tax=Rheinheimera sp. BAL341 TaxID=1708203 RepID=A0A486XJ39_9GAMM